MPTKKWANWSRFKNPGPFNFRHFAKYGRHPDPDKEFIFFNKVGAVPIPRRLLPRMRKAIKVIEECDLVPLAAELRDFRETDVRNTIGRIDAWKLYEKARPSAAAEKAYFFDRVAKLRQVAAVLRHEEFSSEVIESVIERADTLKRTADAIVVQRHKPTPGQAKEFAVMDAWWLLTQFRKWHPGVTRKGPWQKLSSILYDGNASSIGIEYLQRKHDEMCKKSEEAWAIRED
jgi:hypothetical protein